VALTYLIEFMWGILKYNISKLFSDKIKSLTKDHVAPHYLGWWE
jgi:hypothetical protein